MLNVLRKLEKGLTVIEENALSIGIIGMMVVLILNFLGRYLFGIGVAWTEEIGKLCMVLVTYMGLSYVTRLARHINMTILTERMHQKYQRILQILLNLTSGAFFCYLFCSAIRYAFIVKGTGRVTTTLRMPVYVFICMMAVGFLFTAARFLQIGILNILNPNDVYFAADHPGAVVETDADTAHRLQSEEADS